MRSVALVLLAWTAVVSVTAFDEDEALQWYKGVAAEVGMTEEGAQALLVVLKNHEPKTGPELPTVEELDEIVAEIRPKIKEEAKAVLSPEDLARVDTMLDVIHKASIEYIEYMKKQQEGAQK